MTKLSKARPRRSGAWSNSAAALTPYTPTAVGALGRWPKIAGEAALDLSGVELSQALGAVSTTHTKRARQLPASVSGLALEKGRRPVYPNQSGAPCDDRADFHSAQRH